MLMTALPPDRATTLKTAFRACNVDPLSGDAIARYYVDLSAVRKTEAIEGVNTILDFQEPGEFTTLLFTGHRGCGKSTEMMFNLSVLEYNGNTRWNYPNPVVKQSDAFQAALRAAQNQ